MKRGLEARLDEEHFYGNFRSYYRFHPTAARLNLLPGGMLEAIWQSHGCPTRFVILDLGCNEGDLSYGVYLLARREIPSQVHVKLLGVDIDPILIGKAQSKYASENDCKFLCCDILSEYFDTIVKEYMAENSIEKFSLISLFSVTMWLHINCGDEVFYSFLMKCCQLSLHLLIEPQPWKCYRHAKKRCLKNGIPLPEYLNDDKRLSPTRIEDDIIEYISTLGLKSGEHWCLGREEWGRSLLLFHSDCNEVLVKYREDNKGSVSYAFRNDPAGLENV